MKFFIMQFSPGSSLLLRETSKRESTQIRYVHCEHSLILHERKNSGAIKSGG